MADGPYWLNVKACFPCMCANAVYPFSLYNLIVVPFQSFQYTLTSFINFYISDKDQGNYTKGTKQHKKHTILISLCKLNILYTN